MLTKMTHADWVTVLKVFEASRSRCGDKGRDDKKFLSALHYFVVHNITWRQESPHRRSAREPRRPHRGLHAAQADSPQSVKQCL
jgi:hypothetical protein